MFTKIAATVVLVALAGWIHPAKADSLTTGPSYLLQPATEESLLQRWMAHIHQQNAVQMDSVDGEVEPGSAMDTDGLPSECAGEIAQRCTSTLLRISAVMVRRITTLSPDDDGYAADHLEMLADIRDLRLSLGLMLDRARGQDMELISEAQSTLNKAAEDYDRRAELAEVKAQLVEFRAALASAK